MLCRRIPMLVSAPVPLSTPAPQASQRQSLILIAFTAVLLAACKLLLWRSGSLRCVQDFNTWG
jgi:hypothetical protein